MPKLIFDIETIGEDFDSLDKTTQEVLTRWIKKEAKNDAEYQVSLDDLKQGLGFSPLTGEIVAIGVLDADKNQGVVCFQSPNTDAKITEKNGIIYKPMDEKEMLKNFWEGARQYQEFIGFNSRAFDVPFIMARSAINEIRPTKNLMTYRYLNQQPPAARNLDLLEQLSFYGAVRRKGALHMWCRAFGIKSPKADGVTGDDVATLFKEEKYLKIAEYNAEDLRATKELFEKWEKYYKL